MNTIHSQKLIRKTDNSDGKISVTVQELPKRGGFHVSYGGTETYNDSPDFRAIVGQIEPNVYPTAEIAIDFAKKVIERLIEAGYVLVEVDGEPPSSQGGMQTHVRRMPPRR